MYEQCEARTQIGFIFTREPCAGSVAKQASPVSNFYLGSWKRGGHLPVQACISTMRHWLLPKTRLQPVTHDSADLPKRSGPTTLSWCLQTLSTTHQALVREHRTRWLTLRVTEVDQAHQ